MLHNRATAYFTRLVLIAFLLNLALPFMAFYPASQTISTAPQSELTSLLGERMLICTANGFEWVSWAELEQHSAPDSPHPQYQCSACYVTANSYQFASASLSMVGLVWGPHPASIRAIPARHFAIHFAKFSPLVPQSRAPPLLRG